MWTYDELLAAMKADGYASRSLGHGTYEHKNGYTVYLWTVTVQDGREVKEWRKWAAAEQTPPPF